MNDLNANCPVCQGEWIRTGYETSIWVKYNCVNYTLCRLDLYQDKKYQKFNLRREVARYVIWWSENHKVATIYPPTGSIISFYVPFNINEERLKLLITMS